jgi:hypothetical protein
VQTVRIEDSKESEDVVLVQTYTALLCELLHGTNFFHKALHKPTIITRRMSIVARSLSFPKIVNIS